MVTLTEECQIWTRKLFLLHQGWQRSWERLHPNFAIWQLENSVNPASNKWVPFSNQGKIRQWKEKDDSSFHQLCPIYRGTLTPSAHIAIRLWENYRKNSKNWDTLNYHCDCPTNGIVGFYSAIFRSKDADRITNRVDTDQNAPWGAVWSGSALFAQTYLSQYFKLLRYTLFLPLGWPVFQE